MKRTIAILVLSIVCNSLFAQSWEELNKQLKGYCTVGEYEKALPLAVQAEAAALQEFGDTSAKYASGLFNLGTIYYKLKKTTEAEQKFLTWIEVRKKSLGEKTAAFAGSVLFIAGFYTENNQNDSAEKFYLQALHINREVLSSSDDGLIKNLEGLGTFYTRQKKYETAELYYAELAAISKKINGPASIKYAERLNDLSAVFFRLKQYDKSENILKEAARIYEASAQKRYNANYLKVIRNLALLYKATKKYNNTDSSFQKLYSLRTKYLSDDTAAYKSLLEELSEYYKEREMYQKAETYLLEVSGFVKKRDGDTGKEYFILLTKLLSLYDVADQTKKALAVSKDIVRVRKSIYGENHFSYAIGLTQYADRLMKEEQYGDCEGLMLTAYRIVNKEKGAEDENTINLQNNLATLYSNQSRYTEADSVFAKVLVLRKKLFGEISAPYGITLINMARMYSDRGDFEKAVNNYLQAITIQQKTGTAEMGLPYTQFNNIAIVYGNWGKQEESLSWFKKENEVIKNMYGEESVINAKSLSKMAETYQKIERLDTAKMFIDKAIRIMESKGRLAANLKIEFNGQLARLYAAMGENEKAEELFNRQLGEINKEKLENTLLHTEVLTSAGQYHHEVGDYEKAELLFITSAAITKSLFTENNIRYCKRLNDLAATQDNSGQYDKAEKNYQESASIIRKMYGPHHHEYASVLNMLAQVYLKLEIYDKSFQLISEALEINKKQFGENNIKCAVLNNSLAIVYEYLKEYNKADSLLNSAIAIAEKQNNGQNKFCAAMYNNKGSLNIRKGDNEEALRWLEKAAAIRKNIFGEQHPGYLNSLNSIGYLYDNTNQYEKAEEVYKRAIAIAQKSFGEKNPVYGSLVDNFGLMLYRSRQFVKAEPYLILSSRLKADAFNNSFGVFTQKEKEDFLNGYTVVIGVHHELLLRNKKPSPGFVIDNVNNELLLKSLALSDSRLFMNELRTSSDTMVQQLFAKWTGSKKNLSVQYSLPVDKRMRDISTLEAKVDSLERELNRKSSSFRTNNKDRKIRLANVQAKLGNDEAAIEFVRFDLWGDGYNQNDSVIYAAYLLNNKDSVPVFIPLCEEKQLGKYFSTIGGASTLKLLYRSEVIDENDKPAISGDSLYALVWKPLEPYLAGIKRINYSPAGILHKTAFHALPAGDSSLLMDKYELNQYTSTRQIALTTGDEQNKKKNLTLFGGCQFSMDSSSIVKKISASEKANTLITAPVTRSEKRGGWQQLPGTLEEIKSIQNLFAKNKTNTTAYTHSNATEEQFKLLNGNSPKVLHLATHGFFLPDPEKKKREGFAIDERNAFTLADDPLLRSGFVLSGANRVWGGQQPIAGREDGIVTAYEIAQMDLSKTDLVVLSACETALGDIKGNEGVFGLQRAFKMAGVKSMLLSLWKVPDAETAELMQIFYTNYLQGKTAREALAIAQKEMRKKYKPYYWAAFVLIE